MKFYQSIDTLNAFRFNKISESGNLNLLLHNADDDVMPDNVYPELLHRAWDKILDEYDNEICQNSKRNVKLDIIKQYHKMSIDKHIINLYLMSYLIGNDPYAIKGLASHGYYVTKKDNRTDRQLQVNEIVRRLATIDTKIKLLSIEVNKLNNTDGDATFDDIVIIASKHFGYHIDTKKISVKEWLKIVKNLLKSLKNGNN